MSHVEEALMQAGIRLPAAPVPAGSYVPAVRTGDLIYTSGQLPLVDGKLYEPGGKGLVSDDSRENAGKAAEIAAINALAAMKSVLGSLDDITEIVKLTVYVASDPFFSSQHLVANGASKILEYAFGEAGRHVRSAVGVAALPFGASVEIELIASCNRR
jgi:enamine deaminase RidA (YjgF/YER057c/UK114 family)